MLNFRKRKKPNPDVSHLLATILVVYPVISTVSYEPQEDAMLELVFAMKAAPTKERFEKIAKQIIDSLDAYHQLEGFPQARIEMHMEGLGATCFLHVKRDTASLSRGELSVLTTLVEEYFSEELVFDELPPSADPDFLLAQEEQLDQMFGNIRQMQIPDRMVGVREHERVMVYAE